MSQQQDEVDIPQGDELRDMLLTKLTPECLAALVVELRREVACQALNFGLRARCSDILDLKETEPQERLELMEQGVYVVCEALDKLLAKALEIRAENQQERT